MQKVIQNALEYAQSWLEKGQLPDFIPELTKVDPNRLALCLTDREGRIYGAGNLEDRFTIQSISKAIALALAIEDSGADEVFSRVGVEPCGDRFNSIYRLELLEKKPSNPFLNSGAIALASCIRGRDLEERYHRFQAFAGRLLGNAEVDYSRQVCACELTTGHRNRALASMLIDNGIITGDPEEHLELYYRGCALLVNVTELSHLGCVLAMDGLDVLTGQTLLPRSTCEILRALMAGCGLYNSTGAYNIEVGIPAKSGSSGAMMAAARGRCGLGVFSPRLDPNGNSVCGMKALAYLSRELDLRVL